MSTIIYLILAALIGYLFGAVPAGYLLVRSFKGIDLRNFGSGRTGGTNSFRAGGVVIGVVTSVLDVLKAAVAIWVVRAIFSSHLTAEWLPWAEVFSGILSVVGHNWSIFIGWGGGAGTAPNVGWSGAIWIPIVPVAVVVVIGVLLGIGIASLASLAMSAAIPLAFLILYLAGIEPYDSTVAYIVGSIISAAIITWSLRPNIKRLLNGEERIVGPRSKRRRAKDQASSSSEQQRVGNN
jgi:glycerol-3-phosphate acyltransferase PlsY